MSEQNRRESDGWNTDGKMVLKSLEDTRTSADAALNGVNHLREDVIRFTVSMEARMAAQEEKTREIDARLARGAAGLAGLALSFVGAMMKWAWDAMTTGNARLHH